MSNISLNNISLQKLSPYIIESTGYSDNISQWVIIQTKTIIINNADEIFKDMRFLEESQKGDVIPKKVEDNN